MRVLLTGSSGFIGKQALAALLARGDEVIATSRSRPKLTGEYTWLPLDLNDGNRSISELRNLQIDACLHLAWNVDHGTFWTSGQNLAWVRYSIALAEMVSTIGVKKFVGVGTCFEYDPPADRDCSESLTPIRPKELYSICKDSTRRIIRSYLDNLNIPFAWARPFFMYGPGEGGARLVPSICRALARQQPAKCSSGRAIRDFMDVRDVGTALASVVHSPIVGEVNIASGQAVSIAQIAEHVGRLSGLPHLIELGALPDRGGEPARITADITRLSEEAGFICERSLEEGLSDALDFWRTEQART